MLELEWNPGHASLQVRGEPELGGLVFDFLEVDHGMAHGVDSASLLHSAQCTTSSFCSAGSERGPAAAASDGLSTERLFCTRRSDGPVRTTANRGEMAARLGGRAGLPRRQPRAGRAARARQVLHARDAPVSLRGSSYGA